MSFPLVPHSEGIVYGTCLRSEGIVSKKNLAPKESFWKKGEVIENECFTKAL